MTSDQNPRVYHDRSQNYLHRQQGLLNGNSGASNSVASNAGNSANAVGNNAGGFGYMPTYNYGSRPAPAPFFGVEVPDFYTPNTNYSKRELHSSTVYLGYNNSGPSSVGGGASGSQPNGGGSSQNKSVGGASSNSGSDKNDHQGPTSTASATSNSHQRDDGIAGSSSHQLDKGTELLGQPQRYIRIRRCFLSENQFNNIIVILIEASPEEEERTK